MNASQLVPSNDSVLQFGDVDVRVDGKLLIEGVRLSVPRTGLLGLLGPNGAGKSTLLHAAVGLQRISRGHISVEGVDLSRWHPRALARRIGYVPQHIHSHWDLSVRELMQLSLAPPSPKLLIDFELDGLLNRRFKTLSGGEQARAAVARALAHQPALLLADEPAAHLDLPHQHALMRQLKLCAAHTAVVIVLHDLHLAARYCDQVGLLANGRLIAYDRPQAVLTNALLTRAYGHELRRLDDSGLAFFTA